jgi:hypothetical protein
MAGAGVAVMMVAMAVTLVANGRLVMIFQQQHESV